MSVTPFFPRRPILPHTCMQTRKPATLGVMRRRQDKKKKLVLLNVNVAAAGVFLATMHAAVTLRWRGAWKLRPHSSHLFLVHSLSLGICFDNVLCYQESVPFQGLNVPLLCLSSLISTSAPNRGYIIYIYIWRWYNAKLRKRLHKPIFFWNKESSGPGEKNQFCECRYFIHASRIHIFCM